MLNLGLGRGDGAGDAVQIQARNGGQNFAPRSSSAVRDLSPAICPEPLLGLRRAVSIGSRSTATEETGAGVGRRFGGGAFAMLLGPGVTQ